MNENPRLILSVIIPARNEEDCLGECLRSLVEQEEEGWRLERRGMVAAPHNADQARAGDPLGRTLAGAQWEILVVNDGSTDGTRAVAEGFREVTVMDAPPLQKGWTGKNSAAWAGARAAQGQWLLFTDADTVHEPGHVRLAMVEAERHGVGMLSYSPRQVVAGLAQRALMPLVFSDLAVTYPPAKVNDAGRPTAAANGQFLLVRRDVYEKVGGHAAVKGAVLEDVELAALVKRRRLGLRFRYAPEAVSARMYRSFGAMVEGWTKNLALLFGNAPTLAGMRLLELAVLAGVPLLASFVATDLRWLEPGAGLLGPEMAALLLGLVWVRALWGFYGRVARSGFAFRDYVWAPLGVPLYAVLLWRSWFRVKVRQQVVWKGREVKMGR